MFGIAINMYIKLNIRRDLDMHKCETYRPKTKKRCSKEALFLYASRFICKRCAEDLIKNGANPAPTKIKKKASSVS